MKNNFPIKVTNRIVFRTGYENISFDMFVGGASFAPPPMLMEEPKPMTPPPNPSMFSQPPDSQAESGFTIEGKG